MADGLFVGETMAALSALDGKKVMFSSDSVLQVGVELEKYRTILEKYPKWKEDVLWRTAEKVFRIRLG